MMYRALGGMNRIDSSKLLMMNAAADTAIFIMNLLHYLFKGGQLVLAHMMTGI